VTLEYNVPRKTCDATSFGYSYGEVVQILTKDQVSSLAWSWMAWSQQY